MGLLDKREAFRPFEYQELESLAEKIQKTYWVHNEIDFSSDVQQFKVDLTDNERYVIGTILKSFATTEIYVYDEFWGQIGNFLPKPEVHLVATTFAENEWRHAIAYDRLNTVLGLTDYESFLKDPILQERIENLTKVKSKDDVKGIMLTLAIFGCFTEYVNLFSQFAILKSFSCNGRNLLTNIGNIIDWSAKDEALHAITAMFLFNKLKEEYPEYWTKELQDTIVQVAKDTFKIEVKLIDEIFINGDLQNLKKEQLINFMKNRINESLKFIGLPEIFIVSDSLLKEMSWFLSDIFSKEHTDFFAQRPTSYTKYNQVFDSESVRVSKEEIEKI